jgi:hypothetical protein
VAKTRSKSRKKSGASSTRAKGTKKSAGKRKTAVTRAKRPTAPAGLNLKMLRSDIERARAYLGTRPSALYAGASLDETQAALGRLMAEIDGICAGGNCGPAMVFDFA